MPLEKHHKIILSSFSFIIIVFMITSGIFTYLMFVKQSSDFQTLDNKITSFQSDTNSKINQLSDIVLETNQSISSQFGSLTQQFSNLKASVGSDFSGVINDVVKSVVTIKTDSAQGTGFLISGDGYVVTNAHVLADPNGNLASGIVAITYDKTSKPATFIGYDGDLDIALLKISGNYQPLKLADSSGLEVGQKVVAIGNPLGLQFSVSQGIISAINRPGNNGIDGYIQTDAALNPGNSGGPLINTDGNVVGINNFKVTSGENLGFALESNYIRQAVNKISNQALNETLVS